MDGGLWLLALGSGVSFINDIYKQMAILRIDITVHNEYCLSPCLRQI